MPWRTSRILARQVRFALTPWCCTSVSLATGNGSGDCKRSRGAVRQSFLNCQLFLPSASEREMRLLCVAMKLS